MILKPPAHPLKLDMSAHPVKGGQFDGVIILAKNVGFIARCPGLLLKKITLQQAPGALDLIEPGRVAIGGIAGAHRAVEDLPGEGADHRKDGQRNHDLQQRKAALALPFLHFFSPGGSTRIATTGWLSSPSA